MNGCDIPELERKTREYWDRYAPKNPEPCLKQYIEDLLPDEMACAQELGTLPDESCDLLVLLVGHSIEPLLQSIRAYDPQRVLLVLSQRYGRRTPGKNWGGMVKRLIARLPTPPNLEDLAIIKQAGPVEVFQRLLKRVRQTEGVIIDITGAKKNMVAGAFLFAALANVPVSYVDFDEDSYDPERRKPYGYGCRISLLRNPYETFALRDWERVRQLYQRYKFRDVRLLLIGEDDNGGHGTILETMSKYLPDSAPAIQSIVKVLRCYELWDSGDYNQAAEMASDIDGFVPPTAVSELGGKWFRIEDVGFKGGLPNFYKDTPEFRAYVYDELARIDRLIKFNRDYRSAFLRAGSLNEVVMLARLVELVGDDPQEGDLVRALQERTPNARRLFDRSLLRPPGETFEIGKSRDKDISFKGAPDITVTLSERTQMSRWWKKTRLFNGERGWDDFIDRRNDLTHKYFSVPLEWGQAALAFVRANAKNFWGPNPRTVNTNAVKWSELCRLTGIKPYLPLNLTINGDEDEDEKEDVQ